MPGLILRSATLTSFKLQRLTIWRQLLLMLCLVCATEQTLAQATDLSQSETRSATHTEVDGVLSGMDITRRVLGGDDSEVGDWPSVVALVSPGISTLKDRFFCGGTIVAERWILTAAHCLFDSIGRSYTPSDIRVVAGIHDLVDDAGLEEVDVTNIIMHPGYDNSIDSPDDIALLELAKELDAPVGELFAGESEDYTGTIGYIVGWGATLYIDDRPDAFPTTQQEAPVPLVSLATCNSAISYAGLIPVTQLCAGYAKGEIDTCAGDSGGPLYIVENGRVIQMGITSFGNGCGQENFYGIYTNVSHYIPWLSDYIAVPEQSQELIDSREAGIDAGIDSGTTGSSSGAMNPLYLLLLVSVSLFRKCRRVELRLKARSPWRSCKQDRKLLVAPIVLLVSACSVPSIGAQTNSVNSVEPPLEEKTRMSDVHTLTLNVDSLRAGIDGLELGATHEDLVSNLMKKHWQKPVCESGKTALRAKGRLFQTEHCSVDADGPVELNGRKVSRLDLFLLDRQLVRIDVVLATSLTGELSDRTGADMSALLNDTYQQTRVALPGKEPGVAWLWQRQDDQIRWYPERSLQFIDGRLESSLPALYEPGQPFDFD